jgi:hypothetical protein
MIVLWSLVSAVFFLVVFKKVSNQDKIAFHKKKILGFILQLRVYQDRLAILVSSILNIFKHNILYVKCTLSSLLVIIVPFCVIAAQINIRGGYEPMGQERPFTIKVSLDDAYFDKQTINDPGAFSIEASDGVAIQTPPLRIRGENTVYWRASLKPGANAKEFVELRFQDRLVTKPVRASLDGSGFSPYLSKPNFEYALMYNAEGYIEKDSPVFSVEIDYDRLLYPFFTFRVDALVLYLILTMVFALLVKPLFRVTI